MNWWDEGKEFSLSRADIAFLFAAAMHAVVDLDLLVKKEQRDRLLSGLKGIQDTMANDPEMFNRSTKELVVIAERLLDMWESFRPLND